MESYSRKLKRRLAWWRTWWSVCVVVFIFQIFGMIDMSRYSEYYNDIQKFFGTLWFFAFAALTFAWVPSKRKLLAKDLRKDRKNIYAKATLLEMKVAAKRKTQAEEEGRARVQEKIKVMQEELGKVK